MSARERRIIIEAALNAIGSATEFASALAQEAGLDETAAYHCALAVDEACTNIIEHGYAGSTPGAQIVIAGDIEADGVSLVIEDSGPAFDPLSLPQHPTGAALSNDRVGGWGVQLIRRLMDRVEYQRVDDRNRLRLYKRRAANPPMIDSDRPVSDTMMIAALTDAIDIITPSAQGDMTHLDALDVALRELLDRGRKNLVIDLSAVERINTAGVKMLVGHWRRARDLKGDLVLAGVRKSVRETFAILGLDMVFAIVSVPRDAIPLFGKRK